MSRKRITKDKCTSSKTSCSTSSSSPRRPLVADLVQCAFFRGLDGDFASSAASADFSFVCCATCFLSTCLTNGPHTRSGGKEGFKGTFLFCVCDSCALRLLPLFQSAFAGCKRRGRVKTRPTKTRPPNRHGRGLTVRSAT